MDKGEIAWTLGSYFVSYAKELYRIRMYIWKLFVYQVKCICHYFQWMRGSLKMNDYKATVKITVKNTVIKAKNVDSAFSKAIKLEKKIQTLLKENGFDDCDVVTISVEGVKNEQ